MFILGTSSVLTFVGNNPIDLMEKCRKHCGWGYMPSRLRHDRIRRHCDEVRTISSTSVHLTGSSRLPMVAGWDRLLHYGFRV